jgi:hypothetical protein
MSAFANQLGKDPMLFSLLHIIRCEALQPATFSSHGQEHGKPAIAS